MMYMPMTLPLPRMLWKMPACRELQVEKFKETDAESAPATTISMGMFFTTYLRVGASSPYAIDATLRPFTQRADSTRPNDLKIEKETTHDLA